jgi:outer membrane protein
MTGGWVWKSTALRAVTIVVIVAGALALGRAIPASAQDVRGEILEMTLERMVDLALSSSFRVRQLNLGIDRTQLNLQSQRARLRSRVDLEVSAPDYRSISENRWNSTLQREEIVHENSRRLEAELSIRQPVILFGYPTNGYLSLNNRVYRYSQVEDGGSDLRYYNRAFVRYTQPLFQPNELKNDIEGAELDLEDAELGFFEDVVDIVDDVSDDYFALFEEAYEEVIRQAQVDHLVEAEAIAAGFAAADSSRVIELGQIQVELANAQVQLLQSRSQFRLEASSLKTRLNIPEQDSITLAPVIEVSPVPIDVDDATQYALELTPRMRQLGIDYRESEIRLENTKGRGGVQIDLALSYGREMQDPSFQAMWSEPTATYTVGVDGRIPIWDWGERKHRIEASRVSLTQVELRIEEVEAQIRAGIQNEVRNVSEFQNRALAMQSNLELARELSQGTLEGYRAGQVAALDVLQTFRREADTAQNLIDAFMGWRRAIARLQRMTFYDFERDVPVLERFNIAIPQRN